jgi:hypothetical protein
MPKYPYRIDHKMFRGEWRLASRHNTLASAKERIDKFREELPEQEVRDLFRIVFTDTQDHVLSY